jgi:hypothetical protein
MAFRRGLKVEDQRHAQLHKGLAPDAKGLTAVLQEDDLPILIARGDDLSVIMSTQSRNVPSSPK